jgi:hypothetical protein
MTNSKWYKAWSQLLCRRAGCDFAFGVMSIAIANVVDNAQILADFRVFIAFTLLWKGIACLLPAALVRCSGYALRNALRLPDVKPHRKCPAVNEDIETSAGRLQAAGRGEISTWEVLAR